MKPIFKIRKSRSIFRLDLPLCALPLKNVLVPARESLPTAVTFYFQHRLQAMLLSSTKRTVPSPTSYHPSTPIENP